MAITRGPHVIYKLAADAKPDPTLEQPGTELRNTDDRKKWINNGLEWILQDFAEVKKFKVFKDGTKTFVTDVNKRAVQSNEDTQIAVQAQINSMPFSSLYEFYWDADNFTTNNPIIFPSIVQSQIKTAKMFGSGFVGWRNTTGTTRLSASASFPTNRAIFELNNAGVSNANTGQVYIDGFQLDNIAGLGTTNVTAIKIEAGNILSGINTFVVRNILAEYTYRCIHLIGAVWFGIFEDITTYESNSSFVGDNILLIEDGGHTGPVNPTPKICDFNRFRAIHGAGSYNDLVRIKSGGYNLFRNFFVNGYKYLNAVWTLNNTDTLTIHNNTFRDCHVIDLIGIPVPDNRLAHIYLAGTAVFDNAFFNHKGAPWAADASTVKLVGAGVERNYIELPAKWGTTTKVTDTGAGQSNTIRIITGGGVIGGTEAPITHVGGVSRIIDDRDGAQNSGATSVAEGGNIAHGCFATPLFAVAYSRIPGEMAYITARDATNLTISFRKHDNTPGTTPQTVDWIAKVYA